MAIKDFPANIVPDDEEWTLTYNSQTFESDLTGAIQTAELPGARWSVRMTFGNRQGREARALQGFLAGLKGQAGRFWVTPADWEPLGSITGPMTVGPGVTLSLDFASDQYFINDQTVTETYTGTSIPFHGAPANEEGLLFAGDYVEIIGELKKLTEDINTDEFGQGVLQIAPAMRIPASEGDTVRVTKPRAQMLLEGDDQANWSVSAPTIYTVNINGKEALDI